MKVSKLIAKLQKCDPNREVIIQKDSEGNGYSPLSDLWIGKYEAETTWSGEALGEDSDIGKSAVFLCPIN